MAEHSLSNHFTAFFRNLNPRPSFVSRAASEHAIVTRLIENTGGEAGQLAPHCFLQGSYKQDTAIYTINDVDIVVLCRLWQPSSGGGSGGGSGSSWDRNRIFNAIAAPLLTDGRYRDKVRFGPTSMCIKVDLGIKLEILPVVYKSGNDDQDKEPFRLYRPETSTWEDGYARYHQSWLTWKNQQTGGNFIPAVKVFEHLRSSWSLEGGYPSTSSACSSACPTRCSLAAPPTTFTRCCRISPTVGPTPGTGRKCRRLVANATSSSPRSGRWQVGAPSTSPS